jgi:hypothetical protein
MPAFASAAAVGSGEAISADSGAPVAVGETTAAMASAVTQAAEPTLRMMFTGDPPFRR